jgi:hypothetical protein
MLIPAPRNLGTNNAKRNEGYNHIRFIRLPLKKSVTVVNGNALPIDWKSLMTEGQPYSYILGNPPFIGKSFQNEQQKKDMDAVPTGISSASVVDDVTEWHI